MAFIHLHPANFVKIDEPSIERPAVRWGKGAPVSYMVDTSRSTNWKNMRRVDEAKLHPSNRATVSEGEKNPLFESCGPAPTTYLTYCPLTILGENFDLLFTQRFLLNGAVRLRSLRHITQSTFAALRGCDFSFDPACLRL